MISPTRIVFMGTPDFAVPSLRALHTQAEAQNWQVVGVVTQPDRPSGRGKKVTVSPVKAYAVEAGLPILQPRSYRRQPEAVAELAELAPDLIVVAAFGQILPPAVLDLPTFGCVNVHASLLPAYRGASPINAAILNGDDETGNTIMLMDEGMDTGPALAQAALPIRPDDTTLSLGKRLAEAGAELLVHTTAHWLAGAVAPTDQDDLPGEPSVCRMIHKQAGRIDWTASAAHIERMIRAYTPWPSAFTTWQGQNFKIWQADVIDSPALTPDSTGKPGQVIMTPDGPGVITGEGLLLLRTVQPAGKRAMDIHSFLNGAPDFVGSGVGRRGDGETGRQGD